MMNRVFIQALCKYPHGGALANYTQNLAKAILNVGCEVILATNINVSYNFCDIVRLSKPITVIPVMPSEDVKIRQRQRETGYCDERLGILRKYEIDKGDKVIVLGLRSEFFLDRLFKYGKEIGFRIICGVLELFKAEDFSTKEEYEKFIHIVGNVYLQSDGILSISEFIDTYFMNKGMPVFRLPPMIDCKERITKEKKMDKYRFIIPSAKDSFKEMLMAFANLMDENVNNIELHLCGIKEKDVNKILKLPFWEKIEKCTTIHAWLGYEELMELYQQMHFLLIARNVCQRTLANFPSKVPEAMACGVVPIVSDVGDYTKYFLQNGRDSIYIEGSSVDAILEATRKALTISVTEFGYFSRCAMECAEKKFDYHVWSDEIRTMLEL